MWQNYKKMTIKSPFLLYHVKLEYSMEYSTKKEEFYGRFVTVLLCIV